MPRKKTAPKKRVPPARRAEKLIERMLREVEVALDDPSIMERDDWKSLYGDKQNMIAHVQKLVQTLGALPENKRTRKSKKKEELELPRLSPEDTALLVAWLKEQKKRVEG